MVDLRNEFERRLHAFEMERTGPWIMVALALAPGLAAWVVWPFLWDVLGPERAGGLVIVVQIALVGGLSTQLSLAFADHSVRLARKRGVSPPPDGNSR